MFIASSSSIVLCNAIPVLAEIDESLTIDPSKIEELITPQTKAIMAVHMIALEKSLINAVVEAREERGLTQKQLSELCGVKQPVIARLESAAHSPQINSMLRILKPLGYTLAVVKDDAAHG